MHFRPCACQRDSAEVDGGAVDGGGFDVAWLKPDPRIEKVLKE